MFASPTRSFTAAGSLLGVLLCLACGSGTAPEKPPAVPPPAEAAASAAPTLAERYLSFRDAGCDVTAVSSPVAARALRNLPFAMAGRRFTSSDLSHAFATDGDWYQPQDAEPTLGDADAACVTALREREDLLRTVHCMDAEVQNALTHDPEVLGWHLSTDVAALIGGGAWSSPVRNQADACDSDFWNGNTPVATLNQWSVRVERGVSTERAQELLVVGAMLSTAMAGESLKASAAEQLAAFEGQPLTCLASKSVGTSEHIGGAGAQTCCGTGPFMSKDWYCTAGSSP